MEMNNLTVDKMSTSPLHSLDPKEWEFLYQIKKELSLKSLNEATGLVTAVLQGLRQTLTLPNATTFLNKLPDFLKLVFISNWKCDEDHVAVKHLDEFVSLVMEREKESKKPFFKNEIQALFIVIFTLKKLYKLIDLDNFDGFSQVLRQELRNIPAEAA